MSKTTKTDYFVEYFAFLISLKKVYLKVVEFLFKVFLI